MRRRHVVFLVLLAAGSAYFALGPRGTRSEVRRTLERGAESLSRSGDESDAAESARLSNELGALLAPDVRVDVPGAFEGTGRDGAIAAAVKLSHGKHPVIELSHIDVAIDDATHANARFDVSISESQAGDLHAETRLGRAGLAKQGDSWRITSLGVEPETRPEPEPRP